MIPGAFKLQRPVPDKLEAHLNIDFSSIQTPYARLPRTRERGTSANAVAPKLSIEIDMLIGRR